MVSSFGDDFFWVAYCVRLLAAKWGFRASLDAACRHYKGPHVLGLLDRSNFKRFRGSKADGSCHYLAQSRAVFGC